MKQLSLFENVPEEEVISEEEYPEAKWDNQIEWEEEFLPKP